MRLADPHSTASFLLSEEREEFRRSVRGLLEKIAPEPEVRRLMATEDGYEQETWARLAAELGLQGLAIPEQHGGSGYGFNELVLVFEEMGRVLLPVPYLSTVGLAANALLACGDTNHLAGIAAGRTVATLALTEDDGRWDEAGIKLTADASGRLHGHKTYVLDGTTAALILVVARAQDGIGLYAVDGDASGLDRTRMVTMDETRKMARLTFDGVPARRLGAGWDLVGTVLDRAAVLVAAEQAGGAARCLEMATEYANDRVQFGRQIGSFQAIKHKLANLLMEVESAKSAAYYAGWAAAEANDELPAAAPLAKAYCSDAFLHAAAENIQVHGGVGVTWEHPAHLFFKRAKTSELLLGDAGYQRELLAARLGV